MIADRKLRAPCGGPGNTAAPCVTGSVPSRATRPIASPTAATTHSAGTSQNADRATSRTWDGETPGSAGWAVGLAALFLAFAFWGYGLIRKRIDADAQTGLFVECLLMAGPGLAYVIWLHHAGGGIFGRSLGGSLLMAVAGPATVVPLALFAWTARRLPFSTIGFLQFIGPTIGFSVGIANGERLTPLTAVSFVFIWAGVAAFIFGVWRASRRLAPDRSAGVKPASIEQKKSGLEARAPRKFNTDSDPA